MGIGTSLGAYFEDDFNHQAGVPYIPKIKDDNSVTPDDMLSNKEINTDPKNIYDDQGNIVDYDMK